MAYQLDKKMVIGVSSRALFDLTIENEIFEKQGVEAYCAYQVAHEQEILKPGPGFRLIQSLLQLNEYVEEKKKMDGSCAAAGDGRGDGSVLVHPVHPAAVL